jgi:hypothetical protein
MKKPFNLIALIAIVIVIASCATVGRNFTYSNVELLQIGATKVSEYEALFGKPKNSKTLTTSNGTFDIVQYVYASANPSGAVARALNLEFRESILNSYIYNSGFEEDSTDFNFDAVGEIKIGEFSENDVIKHMGSPNGKGYCPTELINYKGDCKEGYKIFLWVHTGKSKGYDTSTIKSKNAMVVFDENGKVIDIQSSIEH